MAIKLPIIDPVALQIGPVAIRWYALSYIAGFLAGWWMALKNLALYRSKETRITSGMIGDFLSWAIIGILLGGRLGYVLFYNFNYFARHPVEILYVFQGGMAFHGGLIGLIAALLLFSARHKINVFQLSDIIAASAPIGLFFGRIANFVNGELYGRVSDVPWAMVFPDDKSGLPRHPSQLYEAFAEGLLLFIVLNIAIRVRGIRDVPGFVGCLFLFCYALMRFTIEFFRQPDAHIGFVFAQFSMGQILCCLMAFFALALATFLKIKHKNV